ncbi:hypothetical protein JY651_26050 [Pyxidicoccus parkwayensis]|uniref:Polymer-forming cytoskeletal protein n=1 Tax=Pyxidicoccus parkwayensis TaxID=2813578 RepID=A0ABX7NK74_9BACT|nr:hypothetical protein [Pyxidicoccus parkwaysis]QSQ18823.1 hypothetical protein JY651_26050 [Pyxidicoccus parkwaysis]
MVLEPQPYTSLPGARFQPLSRELGFERYNLLEVSDDSVNYEDLFGGLEVDFMVHDGTLKLSGPAYVSNEAPMVCVVEGDLIVDGPLVIRDLDIYVPLWIKGSLRARDLVLSYDAQVFIEGDLELTGNLVTSGTDATHLVVHGETRIGAWLRPSHRGAIYLPASTPDPIEGDALTARLAPTLDPRRNFPLSLCEHVLAGQPLLRD